MSFHSAAAVVEAFADAGRPVSPITCRRICEQVRWHGSLDLALAALANGNDDAALADLLAYRAALVEAANPSMRAARLRCEAEGLDARARSAWNNAADFRRRAGLRRGQPISRQFCDSAQAAERLAAALEEEALRRRLHAADLASAQHLDGQVADLLRALAA